MKKLFNLTRKYQHGWVFLYFLIYLPWFAYLEDTITTEYTLITSPIDQFIPFCEYFIIPYYLWFFYIAGTLLFFFFKSKDEFLRLFYFLAAGMTLFLIISTLFPNGQNLRPTELVDENVFTTLIQVLYTLDTPTNVFPSIHVFNSLGAYIAIANSPLLKKHTVIRLSTLLLTITIVLSTMFLKQHSILDVIGAFVLSWGLYIIIYKNMPAKEYPVTLRN